jgi:hypothetical protein
MSQLEDRMVQLKVCMAQGRNGSVGGTGRLSQRAVCLNRRTLWLIWRSGVPELEDCMVLLKV